MRFADCTGCGGFWDNEPDDLEHLRKLCLERVQYGCVFSEGRYEILDAQGKVIEEYKCPKKVK